MDLSVATEPERVLYLFLPVNDGRTGSARLHGLAVQHSRCLGTSGQMNVHRSRRSALAADLSLPVHEEMDATMTRVYIDVDVHVRIRMRMRWMVFTVVGLGANGARSRRRRLRGRDWDWD